MSDRQDGLRWRPSIRVDQYSPERVRELTELLGYEPKAEDFARLGEAPERVVEVDGNLLTTVGLGLITGLIIGAGGNAMTTTQTAIGVGSVATAEAVGDTQLGGNGNSSTAWYQLVDASPGITRTTTAVTNDTIVGQATFASANANFAWNEWCFVTGSGVFTSGNAIASLSTGTEVMVNHKTTSMGTKVSGAVWVVTFGIRLT